ncbi:MAG: hypothetical protein CG439_2332 [Methylococcaceae bacterium NSP1-2]|nr:hypothetical protein [Methylococcaceae bacterium]OYV15920.1 MAG: hypothetical protein CG439_2332 [Methylococcaceae bacterium NSP1-2]
MLLPDHTHCIWTLPSGDSDYSKRWSLIKAGFSKRAGALFNREDWMNKSKVKHRESTLWQRRFWEHSIRNQEDFNRHIDYVYWNPVKHGVLLVSPIGNIRHSTVMLCGSFATQRIPECWVAKKTATQPTLLFTQSQVGYAVRTVIERYAQRTLHGYKTFSIPCTITPQPKDSA